MCTVSYIPTGEGFILTSSRDENPGRGAASLPQRYDLGRTSVFCPKDYSSQGTWVLTSENNYTLCLLNGAYIAHPKKAYYRHSRGQVPLDFFKYNNIAEFVQQYDFTDLEPFTLLVLHYQFSTTSFNVLRWDGLQIHSEVLDAKHAHVFSSATLYDDNIKELRRQWLTEYLKERSNVSLTEMVHFHSHCHEEDRQNGLRVYRNENLMTVSICSIDFSPTRTKILYHDVLKNRQYNYNVF